MADVEDTKQNEGEQKHFVDGEEEVAPQDIKLRHWLISEGLLFLQTRMCALQYSDLLTLTNEEIEEFSYDLEMPQKIRFRNAVQSIQQHYSIKGGKKISYAETKYDDKFKLILVGNSEVGKSSILMRLRKDMFHSEYSKTVGLVVKPHFMEMPEKTVKLQIYDTAGAHEFDTISKALFRKAHGALIIYDVTNQMSFDNIANWIEKINTQCSDKTVKILIGNKIDLNNRVITKNQGQQLANEYNIEYLECSAKTGDYELNSIFNIATEHLLQVWDPQPVIKQTYCNCTIL